MTSLSRSIGSTSGTETFPKHYDQETTEADIVTIKIGEKNYDFSKEMITKYPKLQDPDARFTIGFDAILPIIWGYDLSCIPEDLLNEQAEKQLFLSNCEFFGVHLSDQMILHVSSQLKKEVIECVSIVQKLEGKKGLKKIRVDQDKEVVRFVSGYDDRFREVSADISPTEVLKYLALGTDQFIDKIVISDFKSKNLVMGFVRSFLEHFRG